MLYRTAGHFKTSYYADHALFPVRQDAILLGFILLIAFAVFPLTANEFVFRALLIPVLIYALAALGLNILTGYAGQLSLGTGAFMGVGAYACYKKVGDLHGERRTLELLSTQARDPGLHDLAKLRLAGLKADQGRLKEAMDIVRKSDPKGELAEPRAKLLQTWEEQLKSKKPAQ